MKTREEGALMPVILTSGGPRSLATVLRCLEQHPKDRVVLLNVGYFQRTAAQEYSAAKAQADRLGLLLLRSSFTLDGVVELSTRMTGRSYSTDGVHPLLAGRAEKGAAGPLGKWLLPKDGPRVPSPHFLPALPMLLLAAGVMVAVAQKKQSVWIGLQWPVEAIAAFAEAARWSAQITDLSVHAPLAGQPKEAIFEAALEHGQLDLMRAAQGCHAGGQGSIWAPWGAGCGTCAGCKGREAAWAAFVAKHPDQAPEAGPSEEELQKQDKARRAERARDDLKIDGSW